MVDPKDCVTEAFFRDILRLVVPCALIMAAIFGVGLFAGFLIWAC